MDDGLTRLSAASSSDRNAGTVDVPAYLESQPFIDSHGHVTLLHLVHVTQHTRIYIDCRNTLGMGP